MTSPTPAVDYSVVVPAYNEAGRIEGTLREIVAFFEDSGETFEVLVVDDGSRDRTADVVLGLSDELTGLRLLRLPENRGKGAAVRAGVLRSAGRLVLFTDADGATPIAEVTRLRAAIDSGADIAIGSRAIPDEDVTVKAHLHRRVMGRVFNLLVAILTVRGFQDTQCGFKLFRGEAGRRLFSRLRMSGFSFDVEALLVAGLDGLRISEIPVNWADQPGSRVRLVRDSIRMARDLVRIRGHVLRGSYRRPGPEIAVTDAVGADPPTAEGRSA